MANRNSVTVGIGGAVVPDYEGSDDYRGHPGRRHPRQDQRNLLQRRAGTYLYVDVVPAAGGKVDFDAGPIAGFRVNKRRHIEDDIVELLPKTKTAFEVGGFAGVSLHGLTNPYDTLCVSARRNPRAQRL